MVKQQRRFKRSDDPTAPAESTEAPPTAEDKTPASDPEGPLEIGNCGNQRVHSQSAGRPRKRTLATRLSRRTFLADLRFVLRNEPIMLARAERVMTPRYQANLRKAIKALAKLQDEAHDSRGADAYRDCETKPHVRRRLVH